MVDLLQIVWSDVLAGRYIVSVKQKGLFYVLSLDDVKTIDCEIALAEKEIEVRRSCNLEVLVAGWFKPRFGNDCLGLECDKGALFYFYAIKMILSKIKQQGASYYDDDVVLEALGSEKYRVKSIFGG